MRRLPARHDPALHPRHVPTKSPRTGRWGAGAHRTGTGTKGMDPGGAGSQEPAGQAATRAGLEERRTTPEKETRVLSPEPGGAVPTVTQREARLGAAGPHPAQST